MATVKTAKEIRVTLQAIKCVDTGNDPGANLEIKGILQAKGTTVDNNGEIHDGFAHTLWEHEVGQNIAGGNELPINESVGMLVFKNAVGDFLEIGGRMVDEDDFPNADDLLNQGFRRVPYDEIKNETIFVGFKSGIGEGEVVARFLIDGVIEKQVTVP